MTQSLFHAYTDTPIGTAMLVRHGGVLAGLYLADDHSAQEHAVGGQEDANCFADVIGQLDEFFVGRRTDFDIDVELLGTPFQVAVWSALGEIPYGRTATYGQVASRIGRPGAARAVGAAIGRNPVSIVVPCHRVIGADGSLTGYGWGIERKEWLLGLEQRGSGHGGTPTG